MASIHDVFISHAGEDKISLAAPIYERLRKLGVRGFLDRDELKIGGNAPQEMTDAMETAPIGLFLLSPEFAMKRWTMKELFCFHRRAEAVRASGGANTVPILIPVFYRLMVAESRYKNLFNDYAEVAVRHHFFDRARSGDVDANIKRVSDALANLAVYTGIENDEGASNECTEEMKVKREELVTRICGEVGRVMTRLFVVPCNVPENSDEVTINFEDEENSKDGGSFEWRLLQEIIREDVGSERRIVGVKGGAGVGKSCALRGVGRRDEVKFRFRGGVYYLSLGMDATVETLIVELLKTLRACGEIEAAEELRSERRLDVVLEKLKEAMKGKKSLLLVDDFWWRNGLGPGTVDQVRQVLKRGSGGVLVVTTRDTAVATKGRVVEIKPRGVLSDEAKRVLLGHAKMQVEEITEAFQGMLDEMLQLCGGLPLCLAIMGRGLRQMFLEAGCAELEQKLEVWKQYLAVMRKGERLVFEDVDDYQNVWTTLRVALMVLEERRGQYTGSGRGLSWSQMHRGFCIMKKQSVVSFRVFARVWGLQGEEDAFYVVKVFSGVGLADIAIGSNGRASGVRLHDLIHDFSVACAKKENEVSEWHRRILEGYVQDREKEKGLREWWMVEDDGYIHENVCRHLWRSGNVGELIELLLNRSWAEARSRERALLSWIGDFGECAEGIAASGNYRRGVKEELQKGVRLVRDVVMESWTFLVENWQELGFQVSARLYGCEIGVARKFVESVVEGEEKPYARVLGRLWGRPGSGGRGEFPLHRPVWVIALHDERHLAVAGVGKDVLFIDLEGMRVVRTCSGHAKNVRSVAFSGDGARAFSWSSDGVVREWDAGTGEEMRCVILRNEGRNEDKASEFWCAAICPLHKFVVTGSQGGTVEMWDIQSGERIGEAMGGFYGDVWCVSVSRDGRRIAAGGGGGTLLVFDASTRAPIWSALSSEGYHRVRCAAFNPDGQLLASGSEDNTIRVWEVESGTQRGDPIRGHDDWVQSVCFSENGQRIISGGDDDTIRIWEATTGTQVGRSLHGHSDQVNCVSMTQDARFVVSGGDDRTVRIWDLAAATNDVEELPENASRVECLEVSVNGRWFVSGSDDGTVRVYDGLNGKQVGDALHAHDRTVECVAISPCGRRFVSGSWDETLCVWDLETPAQVGEPLRGHTDRVTCVAYSPNGEFIVSGSFDMTVRVWSTATHAQVGAAIGEDSERKIKRRRLTSEDVGHAQAGSSHADASCDEKSDDDSVNRHTFWVTCVSVSADGRRIVCGLMDGNLYVWDVLSRKLVGARRCDRYDSIERLEILEGNVVRSVGSDDAEVLWRLHDEEGLVRLTGENDNGQKGDVVTLAEVWGGLNEVICAGRQVRVRGNGLHLATLPDDVRRGQWRYNKSSGVLGIVLRDGRVVFLQIEW